jgi:hypothetical protein
MWGMNRTNYRSERDAAQQRWRAIATGLDSDLDDRLRAIRAVVEDVVKYVLAIGVVILILILAIVGRAAIRVLRDLIGNLWPH